MVRKDGRNARTVANNKYNKKTYDQVAIRVKKGVRRDFNAALRAEGVSAADYLTKCILELIRKHGTENTPEEKPEGGAPGNAETDHGGDTGVNDTV